MADVRSSDGASDQVSRSVDRRSLLKGIVAGGPAIVTLYGGRAWAVSSCGQQLKSVSAKAEFDVNDSGKADTVNRLLAESGSSHRLANDRDSRTNGASNSCLISFNAG